MSAETDKVEFFHLSELPTNITSNFSTSLYCHSRRFDNKFALMCESFWVKVRKINFLKLVSPRNYYKIKKKLGIKDYQTSINFSV